MFCLIFNTKQLYDQYLQYTTENLYQKIQKEKYNISHDKLKDFYESLRRYFFFHCYSYYKINVYGSNSDGDPFGNPYTNTHIHTHTNW